MKWNQYLAVGCVSALILLTGCSNGRLNVCTNKDVNHFEKEYTKVEAFDTMDISSDEADIEIIPAEEYAIECSLYYYGKEPVFEVENGVLKFCLSSSPAVLVANVNTSKDYIKVYVPKETLIQNAELKVCDGDIKVSETKFATLNIRNESGNVNINDTLAKKLGVVMEDGYLVLDRQDSDTIDITSEDGYVKMELAGLMKDYDYDVVTDDEVVIGETTADEKFELKTGMDKSIKVRSSDDVTIQFASK